MRIIQNIYEPEEYEYAKEYITVKEAEEDIAEYRKEDQEQNKYHNYTIVDEDGEDIAEKEQDMFEKQAIETMLGIGLTEDEAERQLEDITI